MKWEMNNMNQPKCEQFVVEIEKYLTMYKDGAIMPSEFIFKMMDIYVEMQDDLVNEHHEFFSKLNEMN